MSTPHMPFRSPRVAAGVLAAILLTSAPFAQAHPFCVSTSAQLQQALDDASDNGPYSGEDNQIELVAGTYTTGAATGNGPFHYASTAATGKILLYGGFNAGCSAAHANGARTKLDGDHATPVLMLDSAHAEIDVWQLTIQNGESNANGAGLLLNGGAGISVLFDIFKDNHTTRLGGGFAIAAHGADVNDYVYFETNLVTNNSADEDIGAGFLSSEGANIAVTHSTVYGNTTLALGDSTGTGGLFVSGAVHGYLTDNIFRGNTLYGFYLDDPDIQMSVTWNAFGTSGGTAPLVGSGGNTTLAPGFVDAAGGDFHLSGASPLLGYSPSAIGRFFDLEGHNFPQRGGIDIGVYSETIFTDGVDGI